MFNNTFTPSKTLLFLFGPLFFACVSCKPKTDLKAQLDPLLSKEANTPFNGIVLIAEHGKPVYEKAFGYSNMEHKTPFNFDDEFVVGSVSKQFTAVLVLQTYDKGLIDLNIPIRHYLTHQPQSWTDSVTIHQLLTHTHGIDEQNPSNPLKFKPGSQFEYNQYGFYLLSQIVERVTGKSFEAISDSLFKACGMSHTYFPRTRVDETLVYGYAMINGRLRKFSRKEIFEMRVNDSDSTIQIADTAISKLLMPAGGYVSTVADMLTWNTLLHGGKLLKPATYAMMTTAQPKAVREHPLFGLTTYGYGTTISENDSLLQLGQTGLVPGFCSMNFYFPDSKTSVILLSNLLWDVKQIQNSFINHNQVLQVVKDHLKPAQP